MLDGGAGDDIYYVDSSLDRAGEFANEGIDEVRSTALSYTLRDHLENLTFIGTGNFTAVGNSLANVIRGASGSDVLTGNGGADTLIGGAGSDTFNFDALADSGIGASADTISDFAQGADRIDLLTIDANASLAGDQAFAFVGANAFTGASGQLRYYVAGDGTTNVLADLNGDANADVQIKLTGSYALTAGDFLL